MGLFWWFYGQPCEAFLIRKLVLVLAIVADCGWSGLGLAWSVSRQGKANIPPNKCYRRMND